MRSQYTKYNLPLALMLFSSCVLANGYVVPEGGPKQFNIDLKETDIVNEKGRTREFPFDLGGVYYGTIECNTPIPSSPHYYRATTQLPASDYGNGYLKFNDYLDLKAEVWIDGNKKAYVTVPFDNVSNERLENSCTPPARNKVVYGSGSKGRVTFRVRKKIINGVQINDRQIIEMFGRLGSVGSGFGSDPMAQLFIESAILYVPDKCTVNEGQLINVEFGEVGSNNLDGIHYPQKIPVRFQCDGGSFENGMLNIQLGISGTAAAFNNEVLKTDNNDLGIQIKHNNQVVVPNEFYPVVNTGNGGNWNLLAAPLANRGKAIDEGDFTASATIVAAFQ